MVESRRLSAVLKVYETQEHEVLNSLKRVYEIVSLRQIAVEGLTNKIDALKFQVTEGLQMQCLKALQQGDVNWLSAVIHFEKRLLHELSQEEIILKKRQAELDAAKDRAMLLEEELLQATVERKKVEQLITQGESSQRILKTAKEEESYD